MRLASCHHHVVLRSPERLQRAASELDTLNTAVFDVTDSAPSRAMINHAQSRW